MNATAKTKSENPEMSPDKFKKIISEFPCLNELSDIELKNLQDKAIFQKIPAKYKIYESGDPCNFFTLIHKGKVRVFRNNEAGQEITLYRIGAGECCFLTASCVMQDTKFPAMAVSEDELEVLMVPSNILQEWVSKNPIWQKYLFMLMASRLSNVATKVEDLAFQKFDKRLAELLLKIHSNLTITKTHQEIALDLGTAREVVSRQLKDFEHAGLLKLSRGKIQILDSDGLKSYFQDL
ncbi:MAG: Crp/Fnr family transcriptional regulator [Spirochaetia bacterium]|nr:Crp/Fnr family transcriptional regulator [Spirochaetia bacterium]